MHLQGLRLRSLDAATQEIRSTWLSFQAVWQLPRSAKTVLQDNGLKSLSKIRLGALLVTYVGRCVIACVPRRRLRKVAVHNAHDEVLLNAGVRWLARTTSISDSWLLKGRCFAQSTSLGIVSRVHSSLQCPFNPCFHCVLNWLNSSWQDALSVLGMCDLSPCLPCVARPFLARAPRTSC